MDDGDDDTYTYIGDDCKYVIPPEFVEDDRENPRQFARLKTDDSL